MPMVKVAHMRLAHTVAMRSGAGVCADVTDVPTESVRLDDGYVVTERVINGQVGIKRNWIARTRHPVFYVFRYSHRDHFGVLFF